MNKASQKAVILAGGLAYLFLGVFLIYGVLSPVVSSSILFLVFISIVFIVIGFNLFKEVVSR